MWVRARCNLLLRSIQTDTGLVLLASLQRSLERKKKKMSVCCIGGVCIPYSAIVPLILLGFRWVLDKILSLGLLPESIETRLLQLTGRSAGKTSSSSSSSSCTKSCCGTPTNASSIATSKSSSNGTKDSVVVVTTIESEEEWQKAVSSHDLVFCKFTATWCKPCKTIAPLYQELASTHGSDRKNVLFCQVDVDDLDTIASQHNVSMMPTFCAVVRGDATNHTAVVVDRMTGSNPSQLTSFVTKNVQSMK